MEAPEQIIIVEYDDKHGREAVAMWRASKEKAIGVRDAHSFDQHLSFLRTTLVNNNAVYPGIHQPSNSVVGIMALDGTELNQLYVHIDYQHMGIGTQLLNLAKQLSGGELRLYTFEVNTSAQYFYEKHGFRITGRGHENEEDLPDIRYEWIKGEMSATQRIRI